MAAVMHESTTKAVILPSYFVVILPSYVGVVSWFLCTPPAMVREREESRQESLQKGGFEGDDLSALVVWGQGTTRAGSLDYSLSPPFLRSFLCLLSLSATTSTLNA